ncbi:YgaP family membrane protein [Deefgea salmonis]|uniref:DUF2892 domain-containing protein n=1 Tax=Deefgea salmonis TaxID=2875502 RepID=A0ABS8BGG4_9NEIS|nr:DUF2892 domain-containing protein [Deefgea salmonis]MCB5194805.1 DUF2892 domain-containing protein [Deefgea salmonis]
MNVGGLDRTLRVLVGGGLILAALLGWIGVWGWIGIVPLATGIFRYCPLYRLLGLNTCPLKQK